MVLLSNMRLFAARQCVGVPVRSIFTAARSKAAKPSHVQFTPKLVSIPARPQQPSTLTAVRWARGSYPRTQVQTVQATPMATQLWRLAGAGAVVGLGATALSGLQGGTRQGATYPSYVSERIAKTYGYVVGGLGLTAGVATYIFRSGLYYRLMNVNPWVMMIGTGAGMIGSMIAVQSVSHKPSQHVAWLAMNSFMGLSLFPLAMFGGALLQRAAIGTAAVVGSISLIAATTRSDNHLAMAGPLSVGLGVVFAASIGSLFFPAMPLLYNVSLYGGLAVFGGFTYVDTQRIMVRARQAVTYDPLKASVGIYMDTINIFTRMVQILANRGSNNRR
eukprot:comp21362_c1_seq1/m.29339 comp21362_c1_seq1/g.29339  ORF comp21362_c1_seq1/g.29339 comp21362_c1_seq1/m.29339 type:complete len:332 (-) comp21362_c1_seq1:278-1273(-)